MLDLPKSTEFNKRIPKYKFYDNIEIKPTLKKLFTEQIKMIYWRNKIASTTMNLTQGKQVTEIEIFEIRLASSEIDEAVLRQIDRAIPYHILFLLEYDGMYQAWIGYKEVASGKALFRVNTYYHTDWQKKEQLALKLEGQSMDAVYESFVRQIAGDTLQTESSEETLQESVAKEVRKQELQKQIDALKAKIRKEKQLNKQMEMNAELKKLRKKKEDIK